MGRSKNKSGRTLNPADAFRKQQRQRELSKNRKNRTKVREMILSTKDEGKLKSQLDEINALEMKGNADKRHKQKKKHIQETLIKMQDLQRQKEEAEAAKAAQANPGAPPVGYGQVPTYPYPLPPMMPPGMNPALLLPVAPPAPPPPPEEDEDAPLPDDEDAPLPEEPLPQAFAPIAPPQHLVYRTQIARGMPYILPTTPQWPVSAPLTPYGYPPAYPGHYPAQFTGQPVAYPPMESGIPPPPPEQPENPEEPEQKQPPEQSPPPAQTQSQPRRGFVGVPTALKVKRANLAASENSKPATRVDIAAANLIAQATQAATAKKTTNIDDDFSKFMADMSALGAI